MKYLDLAAELERSISEGTLKFGQRLPAVRSLAGARGISISTVVEAYRNLELKGMIEARPRAGFFVRFTHPASEPDHRPRFCNQPRSLENFQDLMPDMLSEKAGPSLVRLGLAQPEPSLVPDQELKKITRAVLRTGGRELFDYPSPEGVGALRRRLVPLMHDRGIMASASEVLVTNGCQEALWIALQCVSGAGDTIALESPCYPGLLKIIQSLGLNVIEVPKRFDQGMDLDRLTMVLRDHAIAAICVMPNCANPDGDIYSDENKRALYKLAVDHGVTVIEDDCNRDLYFGGSAPPALKSLDDRGSVIFCSSLSKTVAPSLRIGWLLPGRFTKAAAAFKYALSLAAPVMSQLVLEQFIASGAYQRHLRRSTRVLAHAVAKLGNVIKARIPTANFRPPKGGSLVWVGLDPSIDSRELRRRALGVGVSVAPGTLFSPANAFGNYVRLGWGGTWCAEAEQAIDKVGTVVGELLSERRCRTLL